MSLSLMVRVMEQVDVSRPKQAVLLAMADHAHDDGSKCFPSVDRIAWKSNYKPRAITDVIRELKSDGILEEVAPARSGRPAEYHIRLKNAEPKPTFEEWREEHGRHAKSGGGAKNAPVQSHETGVQSHETGVQSHENLTRENAPEPYLEPQSNRKYEPEESAREAKQPKELDSQTRQCVDLLEKTKGHNKSEAELADLVAELSDTYPDADPVQVCRDLEYNIRHGADKLKVLPSKLRQYFRTDAKSSASTGRQTNGHKPPPDSEYERKPVSKPRSVTDEEAGYEPIPEGKKMSDEEYDRQMAEMGL